MRDQESLNFESDKPGLKSQLFIPAVESSASYFSL